MFTVGLERTSRIARFYNDLCKFNGVDSHYFVRVAAAVDDKKVHLKFQPLCYACVVFNITVIQGLSAIPDAISVTV